MLRRIYHKLRLRKRRAGYHSRFGGLWTDRLDAPQRVDAALAEGRLEGRQAELLRGWIRDGFAILPGAVPRADTAALRAEVEELWARADASHRLELGGVYHDLRPELRGEPYKLLDLHVRSETARRIAFAPAVREFLGLVFERDALLFQSLTFERGSRQPVHQDTAYVVVSSPLELAASWVALEDIRPGSGELQYYPGSHRMEEFLFKGGYRNWNAERDGEQRHAAFLESLHAKARTLGLELASFLPREGDVLLWNADLAHGGAPVADSSATRWSFVSHYCPLPVRPYYFTYRPRHRTVRRHASGCAYSSAYYEL